MDRKRRRRKRKERIGFPALIVLFLLLMLIPLICFWLGHKYVEKNVPDHATGYVVETGYESDID